MRILSWNVNGFRAVLTRGFLDVLSSTRPDIVCLQEIKCSADDWGALTHHFADFHFFTSHAETPGYSGVALLVRKSTVPAPLEIRYQLGSRADKFSREGRILVARFKKFSLYNLYFPSGTTGTTRQDFKYEFLAYFSRHLEGLDAKERARLIICGDFNICHQEIDIHHPKEATRRMLTGFLPKERAWMDRFVALGFADTFRIHNPETKGVYSWWTYRAGARGKNLGWRIDYQFVSEKLRTYTTSATILTKVLGSDHCPTLLEIDI